MKKIKERWTNEIEVKNVKNSDGNPTGGSVNGVGINISWQDGPIKFDFDSGEAKHSNNGAFTEDVVLAVIQRIEFFNEGKFRCRENSMAITKLEECLMWMQRRHDDRVSRKVQGDHKV